MVPRAPTYGKRRRRSDSRSCELPVDTGINDDGDEQQEKEHHGWDSVDSTATARTSQWSGFGTRPDFLYCSLKFNLYPAARVDYGQLSGAFIHRPN
jgi:hypothetical protein